jgi:hypothetical protein
LGHELATTTELGLRKAMDEYGFLKPLNSDDGVNVMPPQKLRFHISDELEHDILEILNEAKVF